MNDFGLNLDEVAIPEIVISENIDNDDIKDDGDSTYNGCKYNANVPLGVRNEPIWSNVEYQQLHDTKVFDSGALNKIFEMADIVYGGKVSDIVFPSGNRAHIKKDKLIIPLFDRIISKNEIEEFIKHILGKEAVFDLIDPNKEDIDDSYNVLGDKKMLRYRFNACRYREPIGSQGFKITFRSLPSKVPTFSQLNVPSYIRENCMPQKGLVIIAGPTGSGKTTLCASILEAMNADENNHRFILAYEQPPEYLLGTLKGPNPIWQHAIGKYKDLKTFGTALRNALRCAPDVIFSGETRDSETFDILPRIAESGHLALTTTHAGSVSGIFTRVANEVGGDKDQVIRNFITYAHLFVVQFLIRKIDGGVAPVHEWLLFDEEVKKKLLSFPRGTDLVSEISLIVKEKGKSLTSDVDDLFNKGLISEFTYKRIMQESL